MSRCTVVSRQARPAGMLLCGGVQLLTDETERLCMSMWRCRAVSRQDTQGRRLARPGPGSLPVWHWADPSSRDTAPTAGQHPPWTPLLPRTAGIELSSASAPDSGCRARHRLCPGQRVSSWAPPLPRTAGVELSSASAPDIGCRARRRLCPGQRVSS